MENNCLFVDSSLKALTVVGLNKSNEKKVIKNFKTKETLESLFPAIDEICDSLKIQYKDFDDIYVTLGPGSNTGLRMAVTQARVFFALKPSCNVFAMDTFTLLFKASNLKDGVVILSDRHDSFYFGRFENNELIESGHIESFNDLNAKDKTIIYSYDDDACSNLNLSNSISIKIEDALVNKNAYKKYTPDSIQDLIPIYNNKI